jgi:hypothetical protein
LGVAADGAAMTSKNAQQGTQRRRGATNGLMTEAWLDSVAFEAHRINALIDSTSSNDTLLLIAEVRRLTADNERLRGLVKLLEWGSCDGCGNRNRCTECKADRMGEWDDKAGEMINAGRHRVGCPAFHEDGTVK